MEKLIDIQLILKDHSIGTDESIALLSIINLSYGLAMIDIFKEFNLDQFAVLQNDYTLFVEERRKAKIKLAVAESKIQIKKIREELVIFKDRSLIRELVRIFEEEIDELTKLSDVRLRYISSIPFLASRNRRLKEYNRELRSVVRNYDSNKRDLHLRKINEYSQQAIKIISDYQNKLFSIIESELNQNLSTKEIKFFDFYDWINFRNNDLISKIGYASSANSLEYLISTLIIFGFDNYSLSKDVVKHTYEYIKSFLYLKTLTKENLDNKINAINSIELPDNLMRTINKYDEIEMDYDVDKMRIKLKLKR